MSDKRLPSIMTSSTTKGGAQKVKFMPRVPTTRNKREEEEVKEEEEVEEKRPQQPRTRQNTKKPQQVEEVRGIFAEGISTIGRKTAMPGISSIIGGSGGRRGAAVDMTMACVEPDAVDRAVDMRDMFTALTALHTPTIIDGERFIIEEEELRCVELPPPGESFLLSIPSNSKAEDNNALGGGTLRMHESGRTSIRLSNGQVYDVHPVVVNLADTYKVVNVESDVAYDLGGIHPKKLSASIKLAN